MKHADLTPVLKALVPVSRFKETGGSVVLCSKGAYTEHRLFSFRDQLFALRGSVFVRLMDHGATSVAGVTHVEINSDQDYSTVTGTLTFKKKS